MSKNAAMKIDEREGLLPLSKVVDDDYWQEKNSKSLKKKAKTFFLIPINDLRMIHLEEGGMIRSEQRKNNQIRILM
jgi:hypothetical protein